MAYWHSCSQSPLRFIRQTIFQSKNAIFVLILLWECVIFKQAQSANQLFTKLHREKHTSPPSFACPQNEVCMYSYINPKFSQHINDIIKSESRKWVIIFNLFKELFLKFMMTIMLLMMIKHSVLK